MTGVRRACCDCAGTLVGCGIDGLDGFCGTVTDSPCAGTFAISFTIPAYTFSCAASQVYNASIPARVVTGTVTQISVQNCQYTGILDDVSCGIEFYTCSSGVTRTADTIATNIQLTSLVTDTAGTTIMSSPCGTTPLDASPPQCYGICLRVRETFTGDLGLNSVFIHGQGYNRGSIADCSEEVLCLNSIGGTADLAAHYPTWISTVTGLTIS